MNLMLTTFAGCGSRIASLTSCVKKSLTPTRRATRNDLGSSVNPLRGRRLDVAAHRESKPQDGDEAGKRRMGGRWLRSLGPHAHWVPRADIRLVHQPRRSAAGLDREEL